MYEITTLLETDGNEEKKHENKLGPQKLQNSLDTNKRRNLNDYHTKLKRKQIFIRLERK